MCRHDCIIRFHFSVNHLLHKFCCTLFNAERMLIMCDWSADAISTAASSLHTWSALCAKSGLPAPRAVHIANDGDHQRAASAAAASTNFTLQCQFEFATPPQIPVTASDSADVSCCPVCCDELPSSDLISLWCNHRYCRKCWAEHFTTVWNSPDLKMTSVGRCPEPKCQARMTTDFVKLLGNDKLSSHMRDLLLHSYLDPRARVLTRCPNSACSVLVLDASASPAAASADAESGLKSAARIFRCPCCSFEECTKRCPFPAHDPVPCDVVEFWLQDDGYFEMASKDVLDQRLIAMTTKSCPSCLKKVQKDEACKHMTCRCGHEWCWVCGKKIKNLSDCSCPNGVGDSAPVNYDLLLKALESGAKLPPMASSIMPAPLPALAPATALTDTERRKLVEQLNRRLAHHSTARDVMSGVLRRSLQALRERDCNPRFASASEPAAAQASDADAAQVVSTIDEMRITTQLVAHASATLIEARKLLSRTLLIEFFSPWLQCRVPIESAGHRYAPSLAASSSSLAGSKHEAVSASSATSAALVPSSSALDLFVFGVRELEETATKVHALVEHAADAEAIKGMPHETTELIPLLVNVSCTDVYCLARFVSPIVCTFLDFSQCPTLRRQPRFWAVRSDRC